MGARGQGERGTVSEFSIYTLACPFGRLTDLAWSCLSDTVG